MHSPAQGCCGITRRGFLLGAASGVAVAAPLAWLGRDLTALNGFTARPVEVAKPAFAMPGPFPGHVVEVHDPCSVTEHNEIRGDAVAAMVAWGMCELTGAPHAEDAWKRFFSKGDIVGVKVNPVGRKRRTGEVGSISSPAVIVEIVRGLKSAGVKGQDIVLFERYADEFREAGYEKLLLESDLAGVRWYASATGYSDTQVDIAGYDGKRDRDPHVAGYDPDHFVQMGFAAPAHDRKDDRRFRSHLSAIVSRMVDKIVTIPVLKDHRSAGVTLALKNMSHGFNNNVARSHLAPDAVHGMQHGPNQCNTFIPTAVAQPLIRQKATLHIMDGLIGVYEGGPGSWNRTWSTWPYKSLFFATDPVAMDHVGWDILDAKRVQEGWPLVARMGLLHSTQADRAATALASLAGANGLSTAAMVNAAAMLEGGRASEVFDRRQPEHVILAGTIGLGVFDSRGIEHRRIEMDV